jgi:hypothetical protein
LGYRAEFEAILGLIARYCLKKIREKKTLYSPEPVIGAYNSSDSGGLRFEASRANRSGDTISKIPQTNWG